MELFDQVFAQMKTQPRLCFFTFRGGAGRPQKIGYFVDMLKRGCVKDYMIVREHNKDKMTYHYHALGSLSKDLKPNWFRKGVHVHMSMLNPPMDMGLLPSSFEEDFVKKYGVEPEVDDIIIADHHRNASAKIRAKVGKRNKHWRVSSVLTYMFKDLHEPKRFENYARAISEPVNLDAGFTRSVQTLNVVSKGNNNVKCQSEQ